MQGRSRLELELLDAESMVGELVPPGGVYAFLAEHRCELFPDSFIADLFSAKTGRPSLPADLIGSVLVLKELLDLSDPQTAEALKYDFRWKVACGRALTETSFDPSTLVYWRRRIAESERPDRVFEVVDAVIAETGVLGGKRKRCVGSTVFDDAVATQDTVTQLVAAMRKVARLVPGAQEVVWRVARLDYSTRETADRLGRPGRQAAAGVGPGERRAGGAGRTHQPGRARARGQGRRRVGAAGAGRRSGRGTGRGFRWHRRTVAHRAQGGTGSGDLGTHRCWKYLNNRAENSHQSTRVRERVMKRFAWPGQAQRFLFAFGSLRQHFRPRRHLISAPQWRTEMTNRFAVWNQIITAAAA